MSVLLALRTRLTLDDELFLDLVFNYAHLLTGTFALKELASLPQTHLVNWLQCAKDSTIHGQVISRIPLLAQARPEWVAIQIRCQTGQSYNLGDTDRTFPLMSVIKPFILLYLLEHVGARTVFQWVGVEPSHAPFNSLEQLLADGGRPRNPMINSGAISLSDKLPGQNASDRCQRLCTWLNQQANCQLTLDHAMLASVRSVGREANQTLARHLIDAAQLENLETALDTYEQVCCLSGHVTDLAALGGLLAYGGQISRQHRRMVNALMLTCGLYEASAQFAVRIGLPIKSGISGALLAIVPGEGVIACYSPALDSVGNSIASLTFVELITQALELSVFS